MITSERSDELFAAIREAKRAFPPVDKDKENYFGGKYTDLDSIKDAVDPILENHGLMITQWPDSTVTGEPAITTRVDHESGQFATATASLVMTKKDPQAQGSAITYIKRYAYVSILGIKGVDVDDDANRATLPDSKITVRGEKVEGDRQDSRWIVQNRHELERIAGEHGLSKVKLAKWYHDKYGKDYKSDTDEQNIAAALVEIVTGT